MSTFDAAETTTLNIPSLLAFALISFLAIRYFFFSSTSSTTPNVAPGSRSSRQVPPERIDLIASMFPQVDRRRIEWDLLRNGGSVQATSERILRTGVLSEPPPSFRAQPAPVPVSASTTGASRAEGPKFENLITRYGLDGRVTEAAEAEKLKSGWSPRREDRQANLKKRREDMVLEARRKMQAKMQAEGKS